MIAHAIHAAFDRAKTERWWKLYVAIDIHGAIFPSTYVKEKQRQFFPYAKETLQYLSRRVDVDLMLFTCSHDDEIQEVLQLLKKNDIHFQFVNKNPEVKNDARGDYRFKPYYNILIDDKAGFEPNEWPFIEMVFRFYPELPQPENILLTAHV